MKKSFFAVIVLSVMAVVIVSGCTQQPSESDIKKNLSLNTAMYFVGNTSTYVFDGYNLTFDSIKPASCQDCWIFYLEFTSTHPGYGDRSDSMYLAQVLTPHEAVVVVDNGSVVSALLDNKWDMITDRLVDYQIANPAAVYCAAQGGLVQVRDTERGQAGYCFIEGNLCEEWAYLRSNGTECSGPEAFQMANPASVYCEQQGGQLVIKETSAGQAGYCSFPDSVCEEWDYFYSSGNTCKSPPSGA